MKGQPLTLTWQFINGPGEAVIAMYLHLDSNKDIYVNIKGFTEKGKKKFKPERNITVFNNESSFKMFFPSLDYEDEHVYKLEIFSLNRIRTEKGVNITHVYIHVKNIKGKN